MRKLIDRLLGRDLKRLEARLDKLERLMDERMEQIADIRDRRGWNVQ